MKPAELTPDLIERLKALLALREKRSLTDLQCWEVVYALPALLAAVEEREGLQKKIRQVVRSQTAFEKNLIRAEADYDALQAEVERLRAEDLRWQAAMEKKRKQMGDDMAENAKLREALVSIANLVMIVPSDDGTVSTRAVLPHEVRQLARAALAEEAK